MEDIDVIKDMLQYRISSQFFYNQCMIDIRNPEVRQMFTQMRDDEMRAISFLQQKIDQYESPPGIVSKIFHARERF